MGDKSRLIFLGIVKILHDFFVPGRVQPARGCGSLVAVRMAMPEALHVT